jgi:hypothetical protein
MDKVLIVHLGFGPTYKKRLLSNIKNNDAYGLYDVLIITDDLEYWEELNDYTYVFIEHIDNLRKNFEWSINNEVLPKEKKDDSKYAKEIKENNIKFPTLLHRFSLIWENAHKYDGFLWLNTDVSPIKDLGGFENVKRFFSKKEFEEPGLSMYGDYFPKDVLDMGVHIPKHKIILSPGGDYYDHNHIYLLDCTKKINEKYKITEREIEFKFGKFDGNFVTFNFPDKKYHQIFFDLLNNIMKEYYENKDEFYFLGPHTIWLNSQEYITSIAMNLLDGIMVPTSPLCFEKHSSHLFRRDNFPEDRFWSWGGGEFVLCESQLEFIEKNYNQLKKFYDNHFQKFNY